MSRMIPRETIDALRKQADVTLDNYGIDCDLYIPSNLDATEDLDIYAKPTDYKYTHYATKVFIEWSPNQYRLRRYGIYAEDETPIIARFGRTATDDDGVTVNVDISVHSYIRIEMEYVPNNYSDTDEFEIVSVALGNAHDAVIAKVFKLAPRRVA